MIVYRSSSSTAADVSSSVDGLASACSTSTSAQGDREGEDVPERRATPQRPPRPWPAASSSQTTCRRPRSAPAGSRRPWRSSTRRSGRRLRRRGRARSRAAPTRGCSVRARRASPFPTSARAGPFAYARTRSSASRHEDHASPLRPRRGRRALAAGGHGVLPEPRDRPPSAGRTRLGSRRRRLGHLPELTQRVRGYGWRNHLVPSNRAGVRPKPDAYTVTHAHDLERIPQLRPRLRSPWGRACDEARRGSRTSRSACCTASARRRSSRSAGPRPKPRGDAGRDRARLRGAEGPVRHRRGRGPGGDRALGRLPLDRDHAVRPGGHVDPIYFDRVLPRAGRDDAQRRPYVLLLEAMRQNGAAALGRFGRAGRESLCLVRAKDGALALERLPRRGRALAGGDLSEAVGETNVKDSERRARAAGDRQPRRGVRALRARERARARPGRC